MFQYYDVPVRSRTVVIVLAIILALSASGFSSISATTPVSDVPTTPASEDIRFTMVPVGDYPLGYFSDVPISAGESQTLEVAVINTGGVALDLRIYGTNARNESNGGFLAGYLDEQLVEPASWLDFEETEVTLEPSEEFVYPFRISVPEGTEPGQYVSAMVVETATAIPMPGSDVLDQVLRFSLSVGVMVPGEIEYSYELGVPVVVDHFLNIPIENTGNYLVRPEGELTLMDQTGNVVASQPLQMGSVYGRNETNIVVWLPDQIPSGEYYLYLKLEDPDSGATAKLVDQAVIIPEPEDPTGVYLREHSVEPNADEIVFANVSIKIDNGGQQLNSVDAILLVKRDGETIDEFPLATNQTFVSGENTLVSRYLPADMWMSGTYTFRVEVFAVEPNSGQRIELLVEDLDAEIVVP